MPSQVSTFCEPCVVTCSTPALVSAGQHFSDNFWGAWVICVRSLTMQNVGTSGGCLLFLLLIILYFAHVEHCPPPHGTP